MLVRVLYGSLFVLLAISLGLLVLRAAGFLPAVWHYYYLGYLALALGHTWYVFVLLAKEDLWPRTHQRYQGELIAVVIPCYNEEPELMERCLHSVLRAEGTKEIFIINDGSTNGIKQLLYTYAFAYRGIKIHSFSTNHGKREGLYAAIALRIQDASYIVTMDSDTVIDRFALVRLVEALKTEGVGAASGDVQLLNEQENWLTRMIGAYYWTALNIARRAQSALGQVACCSGALAGYRSEAVKGVMDAFMAQEFLGEKCTYGEDRHLTSLILREGYDVVYVPTAVAYTYTPTTYRAFMKQQLRWRHGFIKEALFALTFTWRVKPLLFLEILIWELTLPLLSFSIVLLILLNAVLDPSFALFGLLPALVILTLVRHMPIVFYAPRKVPGLIIYSFFSIAVMYWQTLHALFTVKNGSWATR